MSGIFQGDILIKAAIELGLQDMKKNPWLIDHMLSDLTENPYLKSYASQIDACKEWFKNANVAVLMGHRKDRDEFPCVVITMGPSPEKSDMKHMADQSTESVILVPTKIGKSIPYVVKPFIPEFYDPSSGEVGMPDIPGKPAISPGMILVNPENGEGYPILDISSKGVIIESNLVIKASQFGIVPQKQFFKARVEHTFFQESYNISCHAHGDPQTLLWLWSITLYSILRYRESLLEANGFCESVVSSTDISIDETIGGESAGDEVWKRIITITGQTENTWVKSPRRFIESVALKEKTSKGITGGIKIISNDSTPPMIDPTDETWYTKVDLGTSEDEDES